MDSRSLRTAAIAAVTVAAVWVAYRFERKIRATACGISLGVAQRQFRWYDDRGELPPSMDFSTFVNAIEAQTDVLEARGGGGD